MKYELSEILAANNLGKILSEADRAELARQVVDDFERDVRDRESWMRVHEDALKMGALVKEEKSEPWPRCANMKFPLLAMATITFGAEASEAMVVDGRMVAVEAVANPRDPVSGQQQQMPAQAPPMQAMSGGQPQQMQPLGPPPEDRGAVADKIERHLNYQLAEQIPGFMDEFRRSLYTLPTADMIHKKIYWDKQKQIPRSDLVLPKDVVFPKDSRTGEPPRRATHILQQYRNEIMGNVARGKWQGSDALTAALQEKDRDLFPVLEQQAWFDLDGDGFEEPYLIWVFQETKQFLGMSARFTEDDISYADDEMEEAETDADESEENSPSRRITDIAAVNHWVTYRMLPTIDGSYFARGFGSLSVSLGSGIDTLLNQLLDAGTLSNMQGGFRAKGSLRGMGGAVRIAPGTFLETEMTPDELQKAFMPLPVKEPSAVLFQLLDLLINSGERLMSTTDARTGESPPANQPATTTMATLERGGIIFKGILQGIYSSFKEEVNLIVKLNSLYLPDGQYFKVLYGANKGTQMPIGGNDYLQFKEMSVRPVADPASATKMHKVMRANSLLAAFPNSPPAIQNMIMQEYFTACDAYDIADTMKQLAQQPQQPDPVAQAQAQNLQAQAMKFQAETKRVEAEMQKIIAEAGLDSVKAKALMAEIEKLLAEAALTRKKTEGEHIDHHIKADQAIIDHQQNLSTRTSPMPPPIQPPLGPNPPNVVEGLFK